MSEPLHFIYEPEEGTDTCKTSFDFQLIREEGKLIISKLVIEGEKGCSGHPQTISVLLKGRTVEDLPVAMLEQVQCGREFSCSQELVKAIRKLLKKVQID